MNEKIKKIIDLAILAPSGENCQPWRFEISGNILKIFNLPDQDKSIYNRGQRGSLVAHGALLENLRLAANNYGFGLKIMRLLPKGVPNLICELELTTDNGAVTDQLFSSIPLRHTNRKPYKKTALSQSQRDSLLAATADPNILINLTENREQIKLLAQAVSMNEQTLFENQAMHDFFFQHINWTKQENQEKSVGFFIDTLELPPPARVMFKLAKDWKKLNFLNRFGFSKIVAKANCQNYESCGTVLAILAPSIEPEYLLQAGQTLQKVWLQLTALGLQAQPMTGVIFTHYAIENNQAEELSQRQKDLIESSYATISKIFNAGAGKIIMMLRIGLADAPSALSSRLESNIIWK